ncbi:MAG: lytic transglycosylase domain-containing protein [Pseudonocardiaceae bacterium]
MAHRAPQDDHWRGLRLAVHARRTRIIAAMISAVLSVGTPVLVWGAPGLTVDGQPTRPPDDPAGLGITGALPGDPLPSDPLPGEGLTGDGQPGDPRPAAPPGFPTPPTLPDGPLGIPGVVLDAYQRAEQTLAASQPGCHLSWSVLAGIGRIESGHARDGRIDTAGDTLGPILGPALDGSPGVAAIADTDRGLLDQDTVWDRAVGPMQFIPTSWRSYGVDANRDGQASPHNIHDATTAAGQYLCAAGGDLTDPTQLQAAVFRYNHSATYVTIVLRWAQAYLSGVTPTPPAPGPIPPATNGNGGAPIPVDIAPQAVAPLAAVVQPGPPAAPPPATTTTPPPPLATTTTPPPLTTTTPPPVTTTAPPVTTTTPPPMVTTTPPPTTTTPPPTDSSPPSPPPPTTTTAPPEPASDPPPSPLAAL